MTNKLQPYFPMIRSRQEIMAEIEDRPPLKAIFSGWTEEQREEFLDFCTGVRGVKILYDFMSKEIISLDNYRQIQHNKDIIIENRLEAWLAFLCMDEPEAVIKIIEAYPDFKEMYEQAYSVCRNIEDVMSMFSEELRELDRNTVELMIDEMQEELNQERKKRQEETKKLKNELKKQQEELQMKAEKIQEEMDAKYQQAEKRQAETERKYQQALERIKELEAK